MLEDSRIEKVLVVNRSRMGLKHPKLEEVILTENSNVKSIADKFRGYDACFYCMGVSSVGVSGGLIRFPVVLVRFPES